MNLLELKSICQKFDNKQLKKIVNLYQQKYINGNAQGFGDYLRGSYCLFQVAKLLGLEFDMDLTNHPMSQFLENNEKNPNEKYDNIHRFYNDNYVSLEFKQTKTKSYDFLNEFIDLLNQANNDFYSLFSNAFPIFPNSKKIKNEPRHFIRNKLIPNEKMKRNIELRLKNLGVEERHFSIIHVRCGDEFLLENDSSIQTNKFNKIMNSIEKNITQSPSLKNRKYVILSDNNQMKLLLKQKFPQFIIQIKQMTHLGESQNQTSDSIMHTLLDFYTMSKSNLVVSLSSYNWGSGFSEWCAVTYRIPYLKIIY
jgi:hypothetical protein